MFAGAVLQGLSAVVYGATLVLVARDVSPETFGLLIACATIALVGRDVVDFGRSTLLMRMQAHGGLQTLPLAHRTLRAKLLASPLLVAPLVAVSLVVEGRFNAVVLLFWPYAIASGVAQTLMAPTLAAARLGRASTYTIKERMAALATVWLLLPVVGSAAFPIGLTLGSAVACFLMRSPWWNRAGDGVSLREFRRQARPLGVTSLTTDAQYLDVLIVAGLAGPTTAGVYAAASRLTLPLILVISQFSTLILARAAARDGRMTPFDAVRTVGVLAAFYAPILLLVSWNIEWVVRHTVGDQYRAASHMAQLMLIGIMIAVVAVPLGAWMNSDNRARTVAIVCVGSVGLNLAALSLGAAAHRETLIGLAFPISQSAALVALAGVVLRRRLIARRPPRRVRAADLPAPRVPSSALPRL